VPGLCRPDQRRAEESRRRARCEADGRRLRWWLVTTPDFQVVHHSRERIETDSNYGSVLPWWDHLFGTAQLRDAAACRSLVLGLETFRDDRDDREVWLDRLLVQPVREK